MKVSVILKGLIDKEGRQAVYLRVNEGEKRTYKALNFKVRPEQFYGGKVCAEDDKLLQKVKHPNAKNFNKLIEKEILDVEYKAAHGIKAEVNKDMEFFTYAEACIEYWDTTNLKRDSTLRQYRYELEKLKRFRPAFHLSEIDTPLLRSLLKFCYTEGNNQNTAWKTFAKVQALLEKAVEDGYLLKNPVKGFKDRPRYEDPHKDYLTKEQLTALEKYVRQADISQARRFNTYWFLIGCYTGLRYSDMVTFDKEKHLKGGRLVKANVKTREIVSLPFTGKIKELFEAVDYKALTNKNEPYNRMLKEVAAAVGIDFNLTAHTSRHTCGMLCANAGVPIEVTAKILGHTSIKHTQIYYRITNKRIDDDFSRVIL